MVRFSKLWSYAALACVGLVAFAVTFAASAKAVAIAGTVGSKLDIGKLGLIGTQVLVAGLLGAIGGASLSILKTGIKAMSGCLREARFRSISPRDAMLGLESLYRRELVDETKHALLVGFIAGAGLAGLAAVVPTWVLRLLKGAVIFGLVFEVAKGFANSVTFAIEHRRVGRALSDQNLDAWKRHRWERDEEVEEVILNVVNALVLGVLWHSLHAIHGRTAAEINVGVSQSADEVAALYESIVEIGEVTGAVASEIREVEKAGGWIKRLRGVWSGHATPDRLPR